MAAPNFANRTLFHCDNLPVLRGMNSETVDLIATDPPFNKSKDFHATPDSLASGARFSDRWKWDRDVHPDWIEQIADDWLAVHAVIEAAKVTYGEDMAAFLCWLGVRLVEMHRVLKPTGSLYLHIDHTAHAYVKALLDAIFGKRNFRNEIVWAYSGWNKRLKAYLERRHDTVLFYAKSKSSSFHYPTRPWANKREYVKVRKQKLRTDDEGREYVLSDAGGGERVKRYLDEAMKYGVPLNDVWHIDKLNNSDKGERTGFPTQKPLALYERIIKASSNPGDLVLDPFAGCATTPVAAERLGRQWVGVDIWDGAFDIVKQRMEDNRQLLGDAIPTIHYATTAPERTDEGEIAAPVLRLKLQRPVEPWQRLTHAQIVSHLLDAQKLPGTPTEANKIVCAGCGRVLEREFMELDHILPRADGGANDISNRILLCRPCNGYKSSRLTLSGLVGDNRKRGWMQNQNLATDARDQVRLKSDLVRDGLA